MTKEQEVIKYIKTRIKICNENADICDDNNFDEEATYLREESYMLETALNILKEKDGEIEKLEQALARNIAKNFTSSMKESVKSKEDLEMLDKGWQIELEKKDKVINLMAEIFYKKFKAELLLEYGFEDEEQLKQYFERKVKNGRNKKRT